MRYLRLFLMFARAEFQREIEYRANLAMEIAQMLMVISTSVGAVLVLFSYTKALNGWSLPQMMALLGVFYLVQGMVELVFQPSVTQMMEQIRLGTLDFTLLKPINSQFMVSVRFLNIVQVAQVALGGAVLGVALATLGELVSVFTAVTFALTLGCGLILVYTVLLVLATLSFWFVRVDNILVIFESFMDAGRFPIDLYPGWLRLTLSSIVPVGIAVTVPAQAIAGRLDPVGFAATVLAAAIAWWFAGWFWRRGLRNYTGASA